MTLKDARAIVRLLNRGWVDYDALAGDIAFARKAFPAFVWTRRRSDRIGGGRLAVRRRRS